MTSAPSTSDVTCWTVHTDLDTVGSYSFATPTSLTRTATVTTVATNDSKNNKHLTATTAAMQDTQNKHLTTTTAAMQVTQNNILANINATIRTAEYNWISFPTDCPHREVCIHPSFLT